MRPLLSKDELSQHAYAVDVSGFTVLRSQADEPLLKALRSSADQALAHAETIAQSGGKLEHTSTNAYYKATRCLYCWGDAPMQWLEHETTRALAEVLLGPYSLWDMSVLSALPIPPGANKTTTSWHRDFYGMLHGTAIPGYLWFFLCLDDVTPENGATWIVPGSHHRSTAPEPKINGAWTGDDLSAFPSRMQLCGKAGDVLVLNPATLHASGRNVTSKPRRLINVGLCSEHVAPLFDHWTIAGTAIQERASPELRKVLGAGRKPPAELFSALPPGHKTANPQESEVLK